MEDFKAIGLGAFATLVQVLDAMGPVLTVLVTILSIFVLATRISLNIELRRNAKREREKGTDL